MSSIDVELNAAVSKILDEVADEAVEIMKSHAPHPTGAYRGLGSMSTGATRGSITKWGSGSDERYVGTRGIDYANYANDGRGAISKPYPMRFVGSDGEIHRAKSVAGMTGWKFIEKTVNALGKYT